MNAQRPYRGASLLLVIGSMSLFMGACTSDTSTVPITGSGASAITQEGSVTPEPATTCEDVLAWWTEQGKALRHVSGSDPRFSLQWTPEVCTVCKEHAKATLDEPAVAAAIGRLSADQQYILRYAVKGDRTGAEQWTTLSAERMYQIVEQDTMAAAFVHAEPVPEHVPYRTALVGFDGVLGDRSREVVLELDGAAPVRFSFPARSLSNFFALFRSPSNRASS